MWPQGIRPSVAEMPSFLNSRSALEYEPYSTAKNTPMGMTQYRDHIEQLMRFFGQPKKPILVDPEDSYDKEHLDLPDAYEGKNLRMRNILIDMIQESELYPIRVLFPLQRNEDSMTIQWDTWNFNHHQLNRQPEESTPRLLSFNKSSSQESFVRYGIGLMLEHGFYKTPMGRETYMMHLVQIRNATVETMAFGAMVAAVNHAKYKDPNDLYRQTAARDKSMLERLLSEERNRWAQAQKTPYGLRLAESALSRIMISRNGMDADSVVIPDRMFDNAGLQDENRLYYLSGKAGGPPSDAQIEAKSFPGKQHFRSRGFRMADHQPAEDPCYQDQTIGGYFHMVGAHLVDVPPEEYRTSMMDTFIFSRAKDNYVRLYFRDMIRYSGLYHWNTDRADAGPGGDMPWTSNIGQRFFTRSSAANAHRGIVSRVSTHGEYAAQVRVLDRQIRAIFSWGADPKKHYLQREFVRQFAPELESKCTEQPHFEESGSVSGGGRFAVRAISDSVRAPEAGFAAPLETSAAASSDGKYGASSEDSWTSTRTRSNKFRSRYTEFLKKYPQFREKRIRNRKRENTEATESFLSFFRRDPSSNFKVLAEEVAAKNNAAMKLEKFVELLESAESSLAKKSGHVHRQRFVLDKEGDVHKTVAMHCRAACESIPPGERLNLFSKVFERVLPGIVELQIDSALSDILRSKAESTPLEAAYKNGKVDSVTLNQADENSPAMLLPGSQSVSSRALYVLIGNDPSKRFLKLEYNSLSFTLASSNVVLYALESNHVEKASRNNGVLEFYPGKNTTAYNIKKLSNRRWAYLQLSLSVSLVYRALEDMASVGTAYKADTAIAKFKAIVPTARQIEHIPEEDFLRLVEDVTPLHDFSLLNTRLFSPMIKCHEIVKALFKGTAPSEEWVDATFNEVKKYRYGSVYDGINLDEDPLREVTKTSRHAKLQPFVDFYSTERLLRAKYGHASPEVRASEEKSVNDVFRNELMTHVVNAFKDNAQEKKAASAFLSDRMQEIKALFHVWNVDVDSEELGGVFDLYNGKGWPLLFAALIGLIRLDQKSDPLRYRSINTMLDLLYGGPKKFTVVPVWDALVRLEKYIREKRDSSAINAAQTAFENSLKEHTEALLKPPEQLNEGNDTSFVHPYGWYEYLDDAAWKTKTFTIRSGIETIAFRLRELFNERSGGDPEKNEWRHIMEMDNYDEIVNKMTHIDVESRLIDNIPWFFGLIAILLDTNTDDANLEEVIEYLFYTLYATSMRQCSKEPIQAPVEKSAAFKPYDEEINDENFAEELISFMHYLQAPVSLPASAASAAGLASAPASVPGPSVFNPNAVPGWNPLSLSTIRGILFSIPIHSGRYLHFCLENNIPPHIGVLGFRPHKTFRMGTLIYMNRGKAGSTWWGHADFMLSDDAARKMHFGNFTIYAKTVITNNKFICLFQNIYCADYLGGDAHEIFDASDPEHVEDYMAGENMRDIFICAVPINFDTTRTSFMDITGRFVDSLCCDANTQSLAWYDSADVYSAVWGWRHSSQPNSESMMGKQPKSNTMVFQEQQFLFNPNSGRFDYKIDDAGHWGDENIYPGCTRVIQGHEGMFRSASAVYNRSGSALGPHDIFGPPLTRPMSA